MATLQEYDDPTALKQAVKAHWQAVPCGTRDVSAEDRRRFFEQIERERYTWEPYIPAFARFERGRGKRVLEVGVGAATDFINWVRHGAIATGVDLTEQGVELAKERLALEGLAAEVRQADAERLPFSGESFDIVYSWGVLHHTPDTPRAVAEVHRVLKPGGTALVMLYHATSWTGFMLWAAHALAKLRPWKGPRWAIYHHLESPGTKAYTVREARRLFSAFSQVAVRTQLAHGDLLKMRPDRKYQQWYYRLAWALYPRRLIALTGNRFGFDILIEAVK
jgi:ubiquinone/menaquinone biosynthesis C-methylase UbiE